MRPAADEWFNRAMPPDTTVHRLGTRLPVLGLWHHQSTQPLAHDGTPVGLIAVYAQLAAGDLDGRRYFAFNEHGVYIGEGDTMDAAGRLIGDAIRHAAATSPLPEVG